MALPLTALTGYVNAYERGYELRHISLAIESQSLSLSQEDSVRQLGVTEIRWNRWDRALAFAERSLEQDVRKCEVTWLIRRLIPRVRCYEIREALSAPAP